MVYFYKNMADIIKIDFKKKKSATEEPAEVRVDSATSQRDVDTRKTMTPYEAALESLEKAYGELAIKLQEGSPLSDGPPVAEPPPEMLQKALEHIEILGIDVRAEQVHEELTVESGKWIDERQVELVMDVLFEAGLLSRKFYGTIAAYTLTVAGRASLKGLSVVTDE